MVFLKGGKFHFNAPIGDLLIFYRGFIFNCFSYLSSAIYNDILNKIKKGRDYFIEMSITTIKRIGKKDRFLFYVVHAWDIMLIERTVQIEHATPLYPS